MSRGMCTGKGGMFYIFSTTALLVEHLVRMSYVNFYFAPPSIDLKDNGEPDTPKPCASRNIS